MIANIEDQSTAYPDAVHDADHRLSEESSNTVDYLSLLWRRKWFLLLGVLIGLGAGLLNYISQPPVYSSGARIQIVEPYTATLPVEGGGETTLANSIYDETIVIRSSKVLLRAVELGELQRERSFAGMQPGEIAGMLSQQLDVAPFNDDRLSSILVVGYEALDPATTRNVVQSLIEAYAEHHREQHANVGKETLELIREARGDIASRLQKLEQEYDDFKRKSPLIYRGQQRMSVHLENAENFLAEKQSLLVRRARLESRLQAAREAMDAGEPPEAVLLMLEESSSTVMGLAEEPTESRIPVERMRVVMSRANEYRAQELVPLQVMEEKLLEEYGPGHPLVKDIQSKIRATEGLIAQIEQNERELEAAKEQARQATSDLILSKAVKKYEDDIAKQVELYILAMHQQRKALQQESDVIDNEYQIELKQAKLESAAEIESSRFEREIDRQRSLYEKIVARFDELDILAESEGLKVMPLDAPGYGYQVGPSLAKSLSLGGFFGFFAVFALAYVGEWSNRAYRSAEEVAEHLKLPVLGHIPFTLGDAATRKAKQTLNSALSPVLCTYFRNKSLQSEAYRAIRTALFFSDQGKDQQVIQVTSAVPADGKTTIAGNIAISMAQMGKSVLFIDADMRRPQVANLFGIENDSGRGIAWLLERLADETPVSSDLIGEVVRDSEVANLSLITAGERPDNPAELLASNRFSQVLDSLRERFDLIIVDSPPLLAVTDPSNIAPRVDGVLLVVRLRKDARPHAAQASRMLETLNAKVIGIIINGVGSREAGEYGKYIRRDGYCNSGRYYQYGYGYSYGYSYGDDNRYSNYYQNGQTRSRANNATSSQPQSTADPEISQQSESRQ